MDGEQTDLLLRNITPHPPYRTTPPEIKNIFTSPKTPKFQLFPLTLVGGAHYDTVVSVGPRAEKFNLVCNDHGRMKMEFFYFKSEVPFLGKFDQKTQNCLFKVKFGT